MMVRYKNKIVYDANTGEVKDDRQYVNMLEDFWLPRREGGRGTEIDTLSSGQNLGEMDDVEYFRKRLYKSLNVPTTRMDSENSFNVGRSTEISRDEVKFTKFIKRLRNRFSILFDELLEIHLALRGVMRRHDFHKIKQLISYDFAEDNHFAELKETELIRERIGLLSEVDGFVGKYFSMEYVRKQILRMSEEEVEIEKKRIAAERASGEIRDPFADDDERDNSSQPQETDTFTSPPQSENNEKKEEFVPPKELTEDEKHLLKSMTKYFYGDLEQIQGNSNTTPNIV
jgi:hypothetical protein